MLFWVGLACGLLVAAVAVFATLWFCFKDGIW